MAQNPEDVTNPDLVDAADQGDGPTSVDQSVTTGPSQSSGPLVAGNQVDGPTSVDQPVTTGPSQSSGATIAGGAYSPQSPNTAEVIENDVINQVYGQGDPINVFGY